MPQIYKEQGKVIRQPEAPDTSLMQGFEKQRQGGLDALGKQVDQRRKQEAFEEKKQLSEEKSISTQLQTAAMQIYKNGYTLHENDPAEYEKFVGENLDKLYSKFPDSDAKVSAMAQVSIGGSGYNAKIQRKKADRELMVKNRGIRANAFTSNDNAQAGLGGLYSGQDNNLSPEDKATQKKAFEDSKMIIHKNYMSRYDQDVNGNYIFTAPERAALEEEWDKIGYNALIGYAGENIQSNRKGVVDLKNKMIENKEAFQKEHNVSDKDFDKAIKNIDKIVKGQTTQKELVKHENIQTVNNATLKDMDIQIDGSVVNDQYDNIDEQVAVYNQLQAGVSEGAYASTTDREKIASQLGDVSRAIIKTVEDGAKLSDTGKWFIDNAGEAAVKEINKNLDAISTSYLYRGRSENDKDTMKADMYVKVLGGLMQDKNFDIKGKNDPKAKAYAQSIALGYYYQAIDGILGYTPKAKDPDDPVSVKWAYDEAYFNKNREDSVNNIRQKLGTN